MKRFLSTGVTVSVLASHAKAITLSSATKDSLTIAIEQNLAAAFTINSFRDLGSSIYVTAISAMPFTAVVFISDIISFALRAVIGSTTRNMDVAQVASSLQFATVLLCLGALRRKKAKDCSVLPKAEFPVVGWL